MELFENPFWLLGASSRDDRRKIMELAEEKSLLADDDSISNASGALTNPRKRLEVETAWLPGLAPKRASEVIDQLKTNPRDILEQKNVPGLARANLLATGLKHVTGNLNEAELCEWIIEIADVFDDVDTEEIITIINEDRGIAGFPIVSDHHALELEIDNRRQFIRSSIRAALNELPPMSLVKVITDAVEKTTDVGERPAPLLIDEIVDMYEVEAQDFLDKEEANIDALLERIRDIADKKKSDKILSPIIDELISVVQNWDVVAQPIQVSTKSRGLGHEASARVAHNVRDLAVYLFNEHDKLEISQKIAAMLREVFAEVVSVADKTDEDIGALDDIAEQRKLSGHLEPITELCSQALERIESHPSSAHGEAQKITRVAQRLIAGLESAKLPQNLVEQGKDEIALTLMQCAIAYANETSKWNECVEMLEDAMKYASSAEARKHIRGNLLTANQNKAMYGNLSPISSAPTLWTLNGFGFTLYGSTDVDPVSRSHIATYYFTALFIPIFPISRYRVIQDGNNYRFLGKAPLRQFDKIHLLISVVAIVAVFIGAQ
ncbi:hypothetical protein L2D14_00770 [Thalassospiraceae bacterium LMO-JJ14]|nr:hypothetical protein L2D14_00770 [Thalassospiraceae bacterium LMO-JJ14]